MSTASIVPRPHHLPGSPERSAAPSDAVVQRVDSAIRENPYLLGRQLRVERVDGQVTLQGTVSTYFQKQMAQEAVRRVEGVEKVHNLLEVNW